MLLSVLEMAVVVLGRNQPTNLPYPPVNHLHTSRRSSMISEAPLSKNLLGAGFGDFVLLFDFVVAFSVCLGGALDFAEVVFVLRGMSGTF